MSEVENLAGFAHATDFGTLSRAAVQQVKVRVLGALGAAIAALHEPTMIAMRERIQRPASDRRASFIGGGRGSIGQVAFYNTALSGYLDYTDSYVGSAASCRPSDCVCALLAVAENLDAPGSAFLAAVALAYQIQMRLCDSRPVQATGIDRCAWTTCAVTAATGKLLGLSPERIADVIRMAAVVDEAAPGTAPVDSLSEEALDFAKAAEVGVSVALRAPAGMPRSERTIPGAAGAANGVAIDWSRESLEGVLRTVVKRHMADIRVQAAIDAAITVGTPPVCQVSAIRSVRVTAFQPPGDGSAAPHGADNPPYVTTRAQAEHSLPYTVAVALIDHQVQAPQYAAERIARPDVQLLSRKVRVVLPPTSTRETLDEVPAQVAVELQDGTVYCVSASSYQGFSLRQLDWDAAWMRFRRLVTPLIPERLATRVADCVFRLDERPVRDLTALLQQFLPTEGVGTPSAITQGHQERHQPYAGDRHAIQ